MTSNVGAQGITEPKRLGFTDNSNDNAEKDKIRQYVTDALKGTFRPEFLNRVDDTIIFNKLSDEDIKKISSIMLDEIKKRVSSLGIDVTFDDEVIASLAKEGFDPVYGARPLRRAITRRVEDSFSEAMLRGEIKEGDKVRATLVDGKIEYISQ